MRVSPIRAFVAVAAVSAMVLGSSICQAQAVGGTPTGGMCLTPVHTTTSPIVSITPLFSLPRITAGWFRFTNTISPTSVSARPSAHALRERRASR